MCGLCGIYSYASPSLPPQAEEALARMSAALAHRGPDSDGKWSSGRVLLGHRRLAIIDPHARANQPMLDSQTGSALIFNGEILNYRELRGELMAQGENLRTESDSEALLHLLLRHGPDAVTALRGMFAFALYDGRDQSLLLARDRLGQKPLCYALADGCLVFASEVAALLVGMRSLGQNPTLDYTALAEVLGRGFVPYQRTAWQNLLRLPPATWMKVRSGGAIERRVYWTPWRGRIFRGNAEEAQAEFREHFYAAVRYHLVADVPVGILLSGGVDSTAILAAASEMHASPLTAFSLAFDRQGGDLELPYAAAAAARFRARQRVIFFEGAEVKEIPAQLAAGVEPGARYTPLLLAPLCRSARAAGCKVVLTGDGGDEVMGGYFGYRWIRLLSAVQALPAIKQFAARQAAVWRTRLAAAAGFRAWQNASRRAIAYSLLAAEPGDYLRIYAASLRRACRAALTPEWAQRIAVEADGELPRLEAQTFFDAHLFWDLVYNDANVVRDADEIGMRYGVEARAPFLDHKLVEFAFSLPPPLRVRSYFDERRGNKYLTKCFLRGKVPAEIVFRPKMGFSEGNLVAEWLRGPWRDLWVDSLAALRAAEMLRPEILASAEELLMPPADTIAAWRLVGLGQFFKRWR
ncbi:MAG: asparagine synthase (glutamine-hydrolyzing) [Planctomycetota bacterium]|nr:asparagine synthase (glutamine-hydrolyzing) [Planctomycetota bacterium]